MLISAELKRLIARSYQLGFRNIVAHQWTGSYLLKQYGHHYRKALRILSNLSTSAKYKSACRYVKYKKPPTAPPPYSVKKRNDAVISVPIGAREAMDWVGGVIWGSPIVALAPPYTLRRIKHNDVFVRECSSRTSPYIVQSVSVGALEAMISFRQINEIEQWNPV